MDHKPECKTQNYKSYVKSLCDTGLSEVFLDIMPKALSLKVYKHIFSDPSYRKFSHL